MEHDTSVFGMDDADIEKDVALRDKLRAECEERNLPTNGTSPMLFFRLYEDKLHTPAQRKFEKKIISLKDAELIKSRQLRLEWTDSTNYKCELFPYKWWWCAYVSIPQGHPAWGATCNTIQLGGNFNLEITYGQAHNVHQGWWKIGFDTMHSEYRQPSVERMIWTIRQLSKALVDATKNEDKGEDEDEPPSTPLTDAEKADMMLRMMQFVEKFREEDEKSRDLDDEDS